MTRPSGPTDRAGPAGSCSAHRRRSAARGSARRASAGGVGGRGHAVLELGGREHGVGVGVDGGADQVAQLFHARHQGGRLGGSGHQPPHVAQVHVLVALHLPQLFGQGPVLAPLGVGPVGAELLHLRGGHVVLVEDAPRLVHVPLGEEEAVVQVAMVEVEVGATAGVAVQVRGVVVDGHHGQRRVDVQPVVQAVLQDRDGRVVELIDEVHQAGPVVGRLVGLQVVVAGVGGLAGAQPLEGAVSVVGALPEVAVLAGAQRLSMNSWSTCSTIRYRPQ